MEATYGETLLASLVETYGTGGSSSVTCLVSQMPRIRDAEAGRPPEQYGKADGKGIFF